MPAVSELVSDKNEKNWRTIAQKLCLIVGTAVVVSATIGEQSACDFDEQCGVQFETGQHFMNWSSTVECLPKKVYEPKSAQEVLRVLKTHHDKHQKIRPIGQALSPNGIGMSSEDVLSLAAIDYVEVDKERLLVTVGAGAKVSTVLSELKKHGLTLQNFSSIQEQQIGGWTQVAAHGTGVTLPTVEEMIVTMKLATPTEGLITLSDTANPRLFSMAKVGLGALGVVTELTMKCIPCMELLEVTKVCSRDGDFLNVSAHVERLRGFRHVRYMWIPYTDTVVTVVSNPCSIANTTSSTDSVSYATPSPPQLALPSEEVQPLATKPLSDLLLSLRPTLDPLHTSLLSFSQLRDQLLDIAPLDLSHIKKVNKAEALFWRASEGVRQGDSTDILGFDCGGEQLVMEFCFPVGTLHQGSGNVGVTDGKDLLFVQKLLTLVEKSGIPAASPVEQVYIYFDMYDYVYKCMYRY